MISLPALFNEFISENCDRKVFLQKWMNELGISYTLIELNGLTHLYVNFPSSFYNPAFKSKTVLVHYDRVSPPGANDNSSAVYQCLLWAQRLLKMNEKAQSLFANATFSPNVRLIFTDGEELSGQDAGSFALCNYLKKRHMIDSDFYVLDGCGRGDVLAVSTAGTSNKAPLSFSREFDVLYKRCCSFARSASPESWVSIPVPYGDNAGFIAQGVPCVMLCVLPKKEATLYLRQLQKDKEFARSVMNHAVVMHGSGMGSDGVRKLRSLGADPAQALLLSEKLPKTWRMMHTEFDSLSSLNQEAFVLMDKFLDNLALSNVLV